MKKILLFTVMLFASIIMASAQGSNGKPNYQRVGHRHVSQGVHPTATTNLTIVLNPIQSISVNTSNVSLVYTTVEDYKNGVSSGVIENHLEVYSTGAYRVNVGYSGANGDGYNATDVGGLNAEAMFESINVVTTKEEGVFANVNNSKLQPLSGSNNPIISSSKGVFGQAFDVSYQGAGSDNGESKYINSVIKGNQRTYTATVTYTISPN